MLYRTLLWNLSCLKITTMWNKIVWIFRYNNGSIDILLINRKLWFARMLHKYDIDERDAFLIAIYWSKLLTGSKFVHSMSSNSTQIAAVQCIETAIESIWCISSLLLWLLFNHSWQIFLFEHQNRSISHANPAWIFTYTIMCRCICMFYTHIGASQHENNAV